MADELKEYDQLVKRLLTVAKGIPSRAATVAVNFTKERFRDQNWLDVSPEPWTPRKPGRRRTRTDKRKILVKRAILMRSIRKIMANSDRAEIGTNVPYAKTHNFGEQIDAVQNVGEYRVKEHSRKAHTRQRAGRTERIKRQTVKAHQVKAHRRVMKFKMPQRQFLGNSRTLNRRINDMMTEELNKAITTT
jgi:phage gpG-like protein